MTITKHRLGGGGIDGLPVTYRWEGRDHRYNAPVRFGLCGTATDEFCSRDERDRREVVVNLFPPRP